MKAILFSVSLAWFWCACCLADEPGQLRLLVLCGHPGDAEFRQRFADSVEQLATGLESQWGFDRRYMTVLFGGADMETDGGPYPQAATGPCTLTRVRETVAAVGAELQPDDRIWVVLGGHALFDGRDVWWNLPETDPNQDELAELFARWNCRQTVYFITTPASGLLARPLSRPGRVVICATEASAELQAPYYLEELAKVVAGPIEPDAADLDGDGQFSLLDLYLLISRTVSQRYLDEQFIITEHAQLDDNGDGRFTEVQRRFFPRELDGVRREGQPTPTIAAGGDGDRARQILLTPRLNTRDADLDRPPSPQLPTAPVN
ncbi:MAG: hypothetical protein ACK5Q5_11640 [Planctomycetaceae bacterium]